LARLNPFFRRFLDSGSSAGILLMLAAALALVVANSPAAPAYFGALSAYLGPLSVLHWINDALMALFFLLVGLEIKREMLGGALRDWPSRALPGLAAVGGMIVPALVYLVFAGGSAETARGWAIPAATDIAFALGVLSLLGNRVPPSLKIFLAALAIIDDLGAVLVIAFFYTIGLNALALGGAALVTLALFLMNRGGVLRLAPYLLLGLVLWLLVFLSGVHATIAGVVLALTIPLRIETHDLQHREPPLLVLEHKLQVPVAFLVVPIFGFANAGVALGNLTPAALLDPVPLGVAAGLFLGKQVGVMLFSTIAIRLRLASRPEGASWAQLYGVALLCGIGFTMSLFVGLLAFPGAPLLQDEVKIGVLLGSVLSALAGSLVLVLAARRERG